MSILGLLGELHHVLVEDPASHPNAFKSRPLSQGLELVLHPLLAAVLGHHHAVEVENFLRRQAGVWAYREDALGHNHLSVVVGECSVAVLE